MRSYQAISIIAININTGFCRNDNQLSSISEAILVRKKNTRKTFVPDLTEHTIRFITIRSSISLTTLTDRLIVMLNMTNTFIVTNEIRTWIDRSITCRTFVTSVTFTSVRCAFINASPIVTRDPSTCVFEREKCEWM